MSEEKRDDRDEKAAEFQSVSGEAGGSGTGPGPKHGYPVQGVGAESGGSGTGPKHGYGVGGTDTGGGADGRDVQDDRGVGAGEHEDEEERPEG